MQETIERRLAPSGDVRVVSGVRASDGASAPKLVGYASVFFDPSDRAGTEYVLLRDGNGEPLLVEHIMPSAFNRALREQQDVHALFNHESDHVLGRRLSGSLKLRVDSVGLAYEIDPPDTPIANTVLENVARGDVDGSSFAFSVKRPGGERFVRSKDPNLPDVRELTDLDLSDISVVTKPAFSGATVGVREATGRHDGREEAIKRWEAFKAETRVAKIGSAAGATKFSHDDDYILGDDVAWDATAALQRCRAWASRGDGLDYQKFARAFAFSDGTSSEDGCKLLHHDIFNGTLHTSVAGVRACIREMDDDDDEDRGIPAEHRAAVRSHLMRHMERHAEDDLDDDEEYDDGDDEEKERQRKARSAADRRRLDEADAQTRQLERDDRERRRLEKELRRQPAADDGRGALHVPLNPAGALDLDALDAEMIAAPAGAFSSGLSAA